MSKKTGRIVKPSGELVALGSAPVASAFKRDSAPSGSSAATRPIPPPEKRPKLQPVAPTKPPLAKKLASELPGMKKDAGSDPATSAAAAFDIEQFYSLVSGATIPSAQCDLLLRRCATYIAGNAAKLDNNFILSLLHLVNDRPELFRSSHIITNFSALLHCKPHSSQDRKLATLAPVLAANVLFFAYRHESSWPSEFIAFYVEDALGERIWVERPECSLFVYHLVKAFSTRLPPHLEELIRGSVMKKGFKTMNESVIGFQRCLATINSSLSASVEQASRFSADWDTVAMSVSDNVRDFISRKQTGETQLQNLLKVMLLSCCFAEIRKIASEKLEFWLQNQKIVKLAQDLLMTVCMNSTGETQLETDTVNAIIKLKYASKQKHLSSHFLSCIRQLLSSNPPLSRKLIVQHVAASELVPPSSGPRPIANVSLLDAAFSVDGGWATNHILADYFGEVITTAKEDSLRGLRLAFRDIVNGVKSQQLNLKVFVDVLLKLTDKTGNDKALRDRIIVSVADIVCLSQQLSVSEMIISSFENFRLPDPAVFGSPTTATSLESTSQTETTIRKFQEQVSSIQLSATKWWLGLKPTGEALGTGLRTLLMMDSPASYAQRDGFPGEPERTAIFKVLTNNIPSSESMFQIIIQSPFATEQHYYSYQLMDILCGLLARNASLIRRSLPSTVPFKNGELINNLLEQSRYNVDKSYGEYHPLAVTSIYWKAWIVILLSVAVNPSGLGAQFWNLYPTLRYLMEMCMTGCYEFPSVAVASQTLRETAISEEKRITDEERKAIDTLSQTLKATLGNQVMYFEPSGPARKPPDAFFVELAKLNDQIGIGAMLCKSREPDFLQALTTQSQTAGRPMPWLRNLIMNADDALFVLPVHCVCQFVLDIEQMPSETKTAQEAEKCAKLHEQMMSLVLSAAPAKAKEFTLASQIIVNFATRLSSPSPTQRSAARRCLSKICSPLEPTDENFQLEALFNLPVYSGSEGAILKSLHEALNVELDVQILTRYLQFILRKNLMFMDPGLREPLVVDVCRFLVERRSLSIEGPKSILPSAPHSSSWSSDRIDLHEKLVSLLSDYFSLVLSDAQLQTNQDFLDPQRHVKVTFKTDGGQTRVFHIVVVEAAVLLAALKTISSPSQASLLRLWFSTDANTRPTFHHVIDPDQMLSRGNPFKQDWLRQILLNSAQPLLLDTVFAYCSPIDLLALVRSFGIEPAVTGRFLEELDKHCVRSPTLANDVMPTGNVGDARFIRRCIQVYQKRFTQLGKPPGLSTLPGQKFMDCINNLIAVKQQQLERKMSVIVKNPAQAASGPASPSSAPASPMEEGAPASPCGGDPAFDGDLFFSLPNMFRIITGLTTQRNGEDQKRIVDTFESEVRRNNFVPARDFALNSPGVCLMFLNALKKAANVDENLRRKVIEICQRLFKEGGSDWREIVRSSDFAGEMKDFLKTEAKLSAEKEAVEEDDGGIGSPTEAPSDLQLRVPDEIEFSDEQQIAKFIFLSERWSLGDGLRLCSILLERRDAQAVWNVVVILLETPVAELPRDCHLIFGFIDAAFRRPMTFLGREVTSAKDCDLILSVLPDLSDRHIKNLLEIVDRSFVDNTDAVVDLLNVLVIKYSDRIDIFVDWVATRLADEDGALIAARMELTMKLYARVPGLMTRLLEKQRLRTASSLHRLEAVADSTVQTLLLAIGSNDMKRGWTERIREATSMCRRLAILHPGLVLNNLHLLATLMQGRNTAVSFPQFRTLNHTSIFNNLLTILLLLQPNVFANRHADALRIVIDSCMDIFQLYISEADSLRNLIMKFAKLLLGMLNTNLPMAVKLLGSQHCQLISRLRQLLRSDVPELESVDSMLESIVHAPKSGPASEVDGVFNFVVEDIGAGEYTSEVQDLIERLERRRKSVEGLLSILTEVEMFTRHRPAALIHFSNQLVDLLFDDSVQVGIKVHMLLDRLLRNVPGSLSFFFDQWLAAFRKTSLSSNPPGIDALNLFLKNEAYDMCSMFPERSLLVIELLFELTASGRLTSTETLIRCIRELNCESMFTA